MKLYYAPGACSLSPHIVAEEAGIRLDLEKVDLKTHKTEGGEDFYTINSKGYVPALRLDDGQILTENVAVLLYIADRNPAARLAPAEGMLERYRVIEWLAFINSEIHKNYTPLFYPTASEDTKQFLTGDTFTVADAYLFAVLGWSAHVAVDLGKWPNLKRFRSDLTSRPAVKSALKAEGLSK